MQKLVADKLPNAKWYEHEPVNFGIHQQAATISFGQSVAPYFKYAAAGVIVSLDAETKRQVIDLEATRKSRAACREERGARAVPVKQWMAMERERLLRHELGREVKEMYNDVFGFSERWGGEYREFWELPVDFVFEV